MRPPSSTSEAGLLDGVLGRGAVRLATADEAFLAAMLHVETALAGVQAELGIVPRAAAEAIAAAVGTVRPKIADLSPAAAASGNPVVPLVAQLRAAVPAEVAPFIHKGATSQDIMDTATMLVARAALTHLLADLRAAAHAAGDLARRYRDTPMVARTLLQQAVPTTFGLKAANWMIALDEAAARLAQVRDTRLASQFGGPAGTLAGLNGAGPEIARRLAAELGLAEPVLPWHTDRTRLAELAGALGAAAGVAAKIARDVTLLAQGEVAEASEGTPGGSSSMAHKRNPVAAVSTIASAAQAPGLVATLLAAMVQEHERAAGGWHAEWRPVRELLVATGSAAAWLHECLEHLTVDSVRMRSNLDDLADTLGQIDLGSCGPLVDRALAAHALVDEVPS